MSRKSKSRAIPGAKHTVYDPTFTPREVRIPEFCPECGADLTQSGALVEWNWNLVGIPSHVGRRGVEAEGADHESTDDFKPDMIACAACELSLTEQED